MAKSVMFPATGGGNFSIIQSKISVTDSTGPLAPVLPGTTLSNPSTLIIMANVKEYKLPTIINGAVV